MAQLYIMQRRSDMNPPEPKYPRGSTRFPDYLDVLDIKCGCGLNMYWCNELANDFFGMATFDEGDWYNSFTPVEVDDEMYCSPECAQKYHTREDDLSAAKGTLIAVVASAAIWAGIILTALHVFRGVSL